MRRAAIYAPGGRAPYPSTVVMGAVTARAAGVEQIAVCAPPGPGGRAHPMILAACVLCEVSEVYRMGGAQAIAALAFGTESVERVDVIAGPGNAYVQEAKRQVACTEVGIDGIAGPSELASSPTATARPRARSRSTCWPRPSTGRTACSGCSRRTRGSATRCVERVESLAVERPSVTDALLEVAPRGGACRSTGRRGARTRAPRAGRASAPRRSRRAVAPGGLPVRRRRRRHGLRGLRGGVQPRAAHRGRRALPVRALGGHLPAPDGSRILAGRGARSPRARRRRAGSRRGLSRARRIDGAPRVSRTSHIRRTTGETDVRA